MASNHYLTLDEKIVLISEYANGTELVQCKLCVKYKVSRGAVYSILQRENECKQAFQLSPKKWMKRKLQDEASLKIDETAFTWFTAQRTKNILLSRPVIQEKKVRQIAKDIGFLSE